MAGFDALLANMPIALRVQFTDAFVRCGVKTVVDVACILGSEEQAAEAAEELFGDGVNEEIVTLLIGIWAAAQPSGRALMKLQNRASRNTADIHQNQVPAATIVQHLKDPSSTLMLKTTVAVLSGCRAVPLAVSSASKSLATLSAKGDLADEWKKVLLKCRCFFGDHNVLLPRYIKLFGKDGKRSPPAAHLEVQDDSFRAGSTSPATINGYLKELNVLVAWAASFGLCFVTLSDFDVAVFLKDQCSRGPSVPNGCYRALIWGE